MLYTSYFGTNAGLRLNNELPLGGMKIFQSMTNDCHNEFNIITITRSFTLRAKWEPQCIFIEKLSLLILCEIICYRSSKEREEWVTTLKKAISEYTSKQLSFVNMKFVPKNAVCEPLQLGYEVNITLAF